MNEQIEELKKQVWWEMDWTQVDDKGVRIHPDKPEKETMFEENIALAILLLTNTVFLNSHWWMKSEGWPEDAAETTSLNVNTNDVLAWGCADAYSMKYNDIQEVYEYWEKDPVNGTAVWYCKKMNMMPQPPVADSIRRAGVWDIDNMGLQKNPDDRSKE